MRYLIKPGALAKCLCGLCAEKNSPLIIKVKLIAALGEENAYYKGMPIDNAEYESQIVYISSKYLEIM